MFGYIRAYRPYLRVCELDLYKGIYCGLCRTMKKQTGVVSTFTLSYDLVFLTLVQLGITNTPLSAEKKRCAVHPIKKTACVHCRAEAFGREFEYSADVSMILTYHKLKDDLSDRKIKSRLKAALLLPFFAYHYKDAKKRRKNIAAAVENEMKNQRAVERKKSPSADMSAEPTAAMMRAVFREAGGYDPDLRNNLGDFGYMLGRFIYICDALDDIFDDMKSGDYNPFLTGNRKDKDAVDRAVMSAVQSAELTLVRLGEIYSRISFGQMQALTDNIVYLGLKETFAQVKKKIEKREEKAE